MKLPEQSGVYITRDEKNQTWFKYFETNCGEWYMSWAELKANAPRQAAKLCPSDVPMHVVAWAAR